MLLVALVIVLLQVGVVQQYIANHITRYLSDKTDVVISADRARFSLSRGLDLRDFKMLEPDGDTILVAESLGVSLASPLLSIWTGKRLDIDAIALQGVHLRIRKEAGSTQSNMQALLDRILGTSTNKSSSGGDPLDIRLSHVDFKDISILIHDVNTGQHQELKLEEASVDIERIDLIHRDIIINTLALSGPQVRISKYPQGYTFDTSIEEVGQAVTPISSDTLVPKPLLIEVRSFDIDQGLFAYYDHTTKPSTQRGMDYKHLELDEMQVSVRDFRFQEGFSLVLDLKTMSYQDDKGFRLQNLSCDSIEVNDRMISLPDFELDTDKTSLRRKLAFKFRSFDAFSDFSNEVLIESNLQGSRVAFADLMHFVPSLEKSPFFVQNSSKTATISGQYLGRINNIRGSNVEINLDNKLVLDGNINTRNIMDRSTALVNLGVKSLKTSISYLHALIPDFEPPDNFFNLGSIDFSGRFDGYFQDFVAYGRLGTDLGYANMDMRLDVKEGNDNANYSGEISLIDFDLGRWSGDAALGSITASSRVNNGVGLSLAYAKADLDAVVETLTYKGYTYENFELHGFIAENQFDGLFSINQENVSFEFDGTAKLQDSLAFLDFEASIEELDLEALKLSKTPFSISGNLDIDTKGNSINTFTGDIVASSIIITKADSIYQLDTVSLVALQTNSGRSVSLFSDVANGEFEGDYDLEKIPDVVKKILSTNYPFYTADWTYNKAIESQDQDLDFRLSITDSRNFFDLIGIPGLHITDFQSKGKVSNKDNSIDVEIIAGNVYRGKDKLLNSHINLSSLDDLGYLIISIDSSSVQGLKLNPLAIETRMEGDSLTFAVRTEKIADSLEMIDIKGSLEPHPRGYHLTIDENEWKMLGRYWDFDGANDIVFGKDYIDVHDFVLTDGYRSIKVIDINEKGLNIALESFDFTLIDALINYDKIQFSGEGDVFVSIDNVFAKRPAGMVNVSVPDFRLNDTPYGQLEATALKGDGPEIKANVSILRDTMSILVAGGYNLETEMVDANAKLQYVPMSIFEYIIAKGISGTTGVAMAEAHLHGPKDDLALDGVVTIPYASTTIDYLGATFNIDDQTILVTESIVDATNSYITDPEGNIAYLTGGLEHRLFKDFTQNLVITAENAIILNTTKQDNPNYYGYGKGKLRAEFSGDFDATNLVLNAETKAGTKLNIPVQSIAAGYDESFIKFIDREQLTGGKTQLGKGAFEIKGMDIAMNLTLTEESQVRIIFDEALGDEIVGFGRGDLQIDVDRSGDFQIFGEYEIERGEYLFTAFGVVAKAFAVERGGLVKWTGDPINATLDINGTYLVNAAPVNFIREYLFDDELQDLANNKTLVALKMDLTGRLYEPVVTFDLAFPELTGELKAYAENKVRTVRQNELALNSQVVGLLAFQTFLPDNNIVGNVSGASNLLQTTSVSTLSEFVSSQLSRLFTGLFEAALTDNGLIAGVDFDIGLIKNSSFVQQSNSGLAPDEIEVNFKNRFRFLNERLSLNVGGNYVRQSVVDNNSFFGVDFALEYFITNDRKLKVRMYGRNDIDQFVQNGRQEQYGFGLGYRTEFGTLADFQEGLKQSLKQVIAE